MNSRDWLQYCSTLGTVSAIRFGDGVHVRVKPTNENTERIVESVVMAFSFLTGRNTNPIMVDAVRAGRWIRTTHIPWSPVRKKRLLTPLGDIPRGDEEALLACCTDFFATEEGQSYSDFLYSCFDAVDNTLTSKAAVICACIEGMMKEVNVDVTATSLAENVKTAVLEAISEHANGEELDRLKNRFNGFMSTMDQIGVKDILVRWRDNGVLGIVNDDIKAWDKLRNKAAHGTRLIHRQMTTGKRQKTVSYTDQLEALVANVR